MELAPSSSAGDRRAASREDLRILGLAILLPCLVWGLAYVYRTSFEIDGARVFCLWDDAMISMRYAANLAAGAGLVWNPGETPVQGFSNPGVTLLMAALHLLPLRPEHVSLAFQMLSLAALTATLAMSMQLALRSSGDPFEAAVAAPAVAICAPISVWALQGGDTPWIGCWLLVAVLWQERASRRGEPWPPGLFAWLGAGALLRLDALAYAGVFLLLAACSRRRPSLRGGLLRAALCAVFALVWMAFSWLYYGDPLPNTYYLKLTGNPRASAMREGLLQIAAWWGILPGVALACIGLARASAGETARLCLLLPAVGFAYHVAVGGDWMSAYGSRFAVPALPLLLVLAARGGAVVGRGAFGSRHPAAARALGAALTLAAAWIGSPGHALREWTDLSTPPMLRDQNRYNARVGLYLREHASPDLSLAVVWGGATPYFSQRRALDALGKSDRHIARLSAVELAGRSFEPGHAKWDWSYVLQREPDVILDANRGLEQRRDFRRDYWRIETRGLEFFLRKRSRARLEDGAALATDQETGERRPLAEWSGDS